MAGTGNWIITEDGDVIDRFETEDEAREALLADVYADDAELAFAAQEETDMTHGTFTINDAARAARVIDAAVRCSKVRRLIPDNEPGAGLIVSGTARSIGDERGCFAPDLDVRDTFLRVTTDAGLEVFWPVSVLMSQVGEGSFALDS